MHQLIFGHSDLNYSSDLLMLDYGIYEFIPMDTLNPDQKKVVRLGRSRII
jgi:hypothetical protein